jgi:bifunctional non-homologous end joining protein LigD
VQAARDVRQRLDALGLVGFVKTSGGKGLHVTVPVQPVAWDHAKKLARDLAQAMEAEAPGRYTATAAKKARNGRVFVDYLRNSREATAVAPYSTRARPGAPVSAPIAWSELGTLASADRYTVLNMVRRLSRLRHDPWADMGKIKQAIRIGHPKK